MKLLITSVGSLVGKNILDVLEYPPLSRRALVQVIGKCSAGQRISAVVCSGNQLHSSGKKSQRPTKKVYVLQ